MMKGRFSWGLTVALIASTVVLLDYMSKKIIQAHIQPDEIIRVLPFLNLVNIKNTGAAFGLFSGLSNGIFIAVSVFAIIFIIIYLIKTASGLEIFSLSLILGGAVGNLIDRVILGKVVDFIDFFVHGWHWPAFNVADSSLTVGIFLFLWANIRHWKSGKGLIGI